MGSMTPEYLFFFQDIDSNNKRLVPLTYSPDGWENYGINFGRETEISNVVKSYTDSWIFFKDDADYLRNIFFTYGVNRRVRLIVKRLTDWMREKYVIDYTGFFDFTQILIEGNTVSIPVAESGLFKALENRWSEDFEIGIDSICNMSGASFSESTDILNNESGLSFQSEKASIRAYFVLGGIIQRNDSISDDFFFDVNTKYLNSTQNEYAASTIQDSVSEDDSFFLMKSGIIQKLNIDFEFNLDLKVTKMTTYYKKHRSFHRLHLVSTDLKNVQNGGSVVLEDGINSHFEILQRIQQDHQLIDGATPGPFDQKFSVKFNGSHTLENYDCSDGKAFFLVAEIHFGFPFTDSGIMDYSYAVSTNYGTAKSIIKPSFSNFKIAPSFESQIIVSKQIAAIQSPNVFKELIRRIGNKYAINFDTALFEEIANFDLLTSGSGLRGIRRIQSNEGDSQTGATIITNMESYLRYAMVVYNYRLAIDYDIEHDIYTVGLQHYDKMFTRNTIKKFDKINSLALSVDREMLYTSISCGYNTKDTAINGLSEYNCIFNWKTPNTEIEENNLDLVSPYSAATRTIETYIYQNYGNKDDSNEKDSDIYIIGAKNKNMMIPEHSGVIRAITRRSSTTLALSTSYGSVRWYRNDFTVLLGTGGLYIHPNLKADIDGGNTYIAVFKDNVGRQYISLFPFSEIYLISRFFDIRRNIENVSGVINPQYAWNLDFTPKRIMNTHRRELNSYFAFDKGKTIELNTCERNKYLIADGIVEQESVIVGDDPIFKPIIIDLSAPGTKDIIQAVERNREGCFEFEMDGKTIRGFIAFGAESVNVNPLSEKESSFKLLSDSGNDFQ